MAKAKGKAAKKGKGKDGDESLGSAAPAAADVQAADVGEPVAGKDAGVSKDHSSIAPTGKYEVVEVASGKFRMFNERGQAVSPIVGKEDKTEHGKPELAHLIRQASRSNALRRKRHIETPKGHVEA